ncbi:MAG: TrgA family protein [Pseudomonadota bacterium]
MPDGARLTGALLIAALGFALSLLVMPLFPDQTNWGWFVHVNVALGLVIGWRVLGARVGRGWTNAINLGLTGAGLLLFWGLFVQATNEMVRLAMKNRYDGPFEALVAIFEIGAEWAIVIATVPVIALAVLAGVLSGLLTEVAWRIWR